MDANQVHFTEPRWELLPLKFRKWLSFQKHLSFVVKVLYQHCHGPRVPLGTEVSSWPSRRSSAGRRSETQTGAVGSRVAVPLLPQSLLTLHGAAHQPGLRMRRSRSGGGPGPPSLPPPLAPSAVSPTHVELQLLRALGGLNTPHAFQLPGFFFFPCHS